MSNLKYLQVRDALIEQFRHAQYIPGQKLPTEYQLTTSLNVSRTTIRQALEMLEQDGIIEKKRGSGTFYVGHTQLNPRRDATTGLIGIMNFFFMDYIYPEIIRGIEDTTAARGYSLVLANGKLSREREVDSVYRLLDQGIKGLILEPSRNFQLDPEHPIYKLIQSLTIPVVTTHWGVSNASFSSVSLDDIRAGYDATKYLLDHGHTKIAIVYKRDVQAGCDRFEGYKQALFEAGVETIPWWIQTFDTNDESTDIRQGYLTTQRVIQASQEQTDHQPTAIFYFNDHTAQQGYMAFQEANWNVPRDISVIGFDNYHASRVMYPPLTTFDHPKYQLGKWAANILLEKIEEQEESLPIKMLFEPKIVERESVRTLSVSQNLLR